MMEFDDGQPVEAKEVASLNLQQRRNDLQTVAHLELLVFNFASVEPSEFISAALQIKKFEMGCNENFFSEVRLLSDSLVRFRIFGV